MKSYDYDGVTYDGACYCNHHLPDGVDINSEDVYPIFADSEWDSYPVCDVCGTVFDYVNLTTYGAAYEASYTPRLGKNQKAIMQRMLDKYGELQQEDIDNWSTPAKKALKRLLERGVIEKWRNRYVAHVG